MGYCDNCDFAERYPHAFAVYEARRHPLKMGIYDDIEDFDRRELALALMIYKNSFGYLTQMRDGAVRVDLDGRPAGSVTEEEEQVAKRLVKERLTRMRRGRKSAAARGITGSAPHTARAASRG